MMPQNTILIVDDDSHLRQSLSLILQKVNYRVDTTGSAEEALGYLKLHKYDLMFLDLNLPGKSGIELLVEVHKQFPHTSVFILTAHAGLESAIQAVRLGARDYLIKPAEPVEIVTRVAEVLAEREQPARKKEIVDQIQALLVELQKIEDEDIMPSGPSPIQPSVDSSHHLKKGEFELDLDAHHVTMNGKYIPMSEIYFNYLAALIRHAPKAVAYKTLVKVGQGYDADGSEARELARWRIHELRKIIEVDPEYPKYILTVRGTGYRLEI